MKQNATLEIKLGLKVHMNCGIVVAWMEQLVLQKSLLNLIFSC